MRENMDTNEKLVSAIRGLTVAVWVLCAFVGIQLAILITSFALYTSPIIDRINAVPSLGSNFEKRPSQEELTTEEEIKLSTGIVLTELRKSGDKYQSYVVEILKQTSSGEFPIKIGDIYPRKAIYATEDHTMHNGVVALFHGEFAAEWHTLYVYGDRIPGYGNMSVSKLKELIRESQ
jgi:hypothetical protein